MSTNARPQQRNSTALPSSSERESAQSGAWIRRENYWTLVSLNDGLRSRAHELIANHRSFIPEGNEVRIHFWSVHRDARNFSRPETFWPDRWLIAAGLQHSPEELVHNPNAFTPFSFGPANCVGKPVAMQEMRLVVCHFMQKLNVKFAEGYDPEQWEKGIQDHLAVSLGPLLVEIERRD